MLLTRKKFILSVILDTWDIVILKSDLHYFDFRSPFFNIAISNEDAFNHYEHPETGRSVNELIISAHRKWKSPGKTSVP